MRKPYRLLTLAGAPALALGLMAGTAMADMDRPPATAMPMSTLTQAIENSIANLAAFKEIVWDDDGYWDVKMWTTDGKTVDAHVDPVTGTVTVGQ